ncbi:mRNA surveillance protein pelota [Candidatus Woesearchaeota archaeon]|nr:mRNA surveillance protein pelota [Candidatus Woesearchaeota archaeon]
MKLKHKNLKNGEIKVKIENQEDLWYLSNIIEPSDIVKGTTLRKIKSGKEGDRSQKAVRKPMFIELKAEKAEFSNGSNLKILGTITQGPEDIPLGSYHSFTLEENSEITIVKEHWLKYQLDKIEEACKEAASKILIAVHDREEAVFAVMKKYGYDILAEIKGNVQKKAVDTASSGSFYSEIIELIEDYSKRYMAEKIIIASPAFWKEDLMKEMQNAELKRKIILATCSSVGKNGIEEVLKRPEAKEALKQDRISKEANLVEKLFQEISKAGTAAYGIAETEKAVAAGAASDLLVSDSLIQSSREEGSYMRIEKMMKAAESARGEVHIISSEHESGQKLKGIGGIGAILRYRMNY